MEKINTFLKNYFHSGDFKLTPITDSASERKYFRVINNNNSFVLTYNKNIHENRTFLYFSEIFKNEGLPVPSIIKTDNSHQLYLQEDIGDQNLLSLLKTKGEDTEVKNLYLKSLDALIKLQFEIYKKIDFSYCYDFPEFNKAFIYNDLNYFKFYFFLPLEIPYSNYQLLKEFDLISQKIEGLEPLGFMYRDFQSRNILVRDSTPFFIDYQGGIKGNTLYDLVSLLWQAKAQLTPSFKEELKEYYFHQLQNRINITRIQLEEAYQYCLLIRLLQVLGVYGFRGILQRKKHFIESISYGLENLYLFINNNEILFQYPELLKIIKELLSDETQTKIKNLIQTHDR